MHPTTTCTNPAHTEPIAVDAARAAELCGICRAQVFVLLSRGQFPPPVRLGKRAPRWIVAELRAWLEADAPPIDEWKAARRQQA
ncbi:MAG: AlpA family phage regulatory protein [Planctomycetota bacterium]